MTDTVMDKVWVARGGYSDDEIIGVFSTKENAQIVADLFSGSVVEWPLDPGIEELNAELLRMKAWKNKRCVPVITNYAWPKVKP